MKQRTAVYIDLGHYAIKFAIFEKRGKNLSLKTSLIERTGLSPNNTLIESFDDISTIIAAVLTRLNLKPRATQLFITLPGELFFSRLIRLPIIDVSKVRAVLKYEAQQEIPFSLNEVIWDYQILGSPDKEHLNVHLIAIKSEFIYHLLQTLENKGLEIVEYIGASPLAVAHCFINPQSDAANRAYINIGDKSSDIIIVNPHSVWFRTLPVGGNTFTHAIEQQMKVSYADAENLKCQKGKLNLGENKTETDSIEDNIAKAMGVQAKRLVAELMRSLSYYQNQYKEDSVKEVFLTGGSSMIPNLAPFVENNIGLPVKMADPASRLQGSNQINDKHMLSELVGMGVQKNIGKENPPNLLPSTYLRAQQLSKRKRAFIQCGALILLLLGTPIIYHWKIIHSKKAILHETKQYLLELTSIKDQMEQTKGAINRNVARINETSLFISERALWLTILLDLEKRIPPNIWLSRMISSYVKDSQNNAIASSSKGAPSGTLLLTLNCRTTGDYRDAENFTRALEDSIYFKSAKIQSATPPIQGIRNFIIRMEFDPTKHNSENISS